LDKAEIKKKFDTERELRQINFICYYIALFNKLFLYEFIRSFCALVWGLLNLVVAIVIRPVIGNWVLFGGNANSRKFEYLKPLRKNNKRIRRFGMTK